jgi:hypothetical protein
MITCKLQQAWRGECVYEGRIQSASVRPAGVLEGSTARPLFACYVSPFQFCLCIPPPRVHLLSPHQPSCTCCAETTCTAGCMCAADARRQARPHCVRPGVGMQRPAALSTHPPPPCITHSSTCPAAAPDWLHFCNTCTGCNTEPPRCRPPACCRLVPHSSQF